MKQSDPHLLEEYNCNHNGHNKAAFKFVTNSVSALTIAAPVRFISYALIKKDSTGKRKDINLFTTRVINGGVTNLLKDITEGERPFIRHIFVQKETSSDSFAFPSGHTDSAFAFATLISIAYSKWHIVAPSFLSAS